MKRVLLIVAILIGSAFATASPAQAVWRGGLRGYGPYGGAAYRATYGGGYYNSYYGGYGPRAYSYYGGGYYPGYYYGPGVGVGVY